MGTSAKVLTPRELGRVLEHVGQRGAAQRNRCIVLLSFRAGLRACEIAGLSWDMVTGPDGRISTIIAVSGSIAKNGRGRNVPLHSELKAVLATLRAAQGRPTAGPVVRSQRGGHMSAKSIVNWFTALYRQLGFDGCSSHSGRRTFITQSARLLTKAGGSLRDIQELAGHRALTTTERYIEGDREAQRKLIQML
ncbi:MULTISPECIES: tyrosine-type recombinase/integrase [unclassified Sphingopyxis]|uniref:tyrosine-type recombinase/integrase n=1 Tax=unclassified Sphingopyxis TaxID=2614943 RepID=UPI0009EB751C|nr:MULTISPECIES: site-specific integrase [unclassified Sphingopyxis]